MIPISSDPKVNQEYIGNVYKGFGVEDILNYAKENYEEDAMNLFIHNSEEKLAQSFIKGNKVPRFLEQLIQAGMSPDEIRNYLDNFEKKPKK